MLDPRPSQFDCRIHEVHMKTSFLRRWCRPKTILVISNRAESPAHTLEVVSRIRATGARIFLVQLPGVTYSMQGPGSNRLFLIPNSQATAAEQGVDGTRQAFLWAEILSEVTVLRNTPIERISVLADSLGAELVVLTTPTVGMARFRTRNGPETDLFGSLAVPILVFGPRVNAGGWRDGEFRRILLPITFGSDLGIQLRFACRFARRNHGRVTVLHVFDSGGTKEDPWYRTPVAVEAKLPITELKHEGILCPMEITVREGYPVKQILNFNEEKVHDLIIMGGTRPVHAAWGPGHGVTESVIADSCCPVLLLGRAIESASDSTEPISQLTLA
jgi:nucleotide-binding universal stress UspA family protein